MTTPMMFTTCRHPRPADDLFSRINAMHNPYRVPPLDSDDGAEDSEALAVYQGCC